MLRTVSGVVSCLCLVMLIASTPAPLFADEAKKAEAPKKEAATEAKAASSSEGETAQPANESAKLARARAESCEPRFNYSTLEDLFADENAAARVVEGSAPDRGTETAVEWKVVAQPPADTPKKKTAREDSD